MIRRCVLSAVAVITSVDDQLRADVEHDQDRPARRRSAVSVMSGMKRNCVAAVAARHRRVPCGLVRADVVPEVLAQHVEERDEDRELQRAAGGTRRTG